MHNSPDLQLGTHSLPYKDNIKFLGFRWDPKLTWTRLVNTLRTDCAKLLEHLKMITNQKWGSDQVCTMKFFQVYIRAKLDYGAPVFNSAAELLLSTLDY